MFSLILCHFSKIKMHTVVLLRNSKIQILLQTHSEGKVRKK